MHRMDCIFGHCMDFVTGATGILGSRLIYDLLLRGHTVRALRRPGSDLQLFERVISFYHDDQDTKPLLDRLEWVEGDIAEVLLLEEFMQDCAVCYHTAALVSFHPRDHEAMRQVNITGTANVVNACLRTTTTLMYVSSVAALGRSAGEETLSEEDTWKDSPYNSGYAIAKYHAEMEVWRGIEEGLDALIINPTIILGAGSVTRSSGTLYGAVLAGLRYYTSGGANVVDARDVSGMAISLLESGVRAERFVLNAASVPYRTVFDQIADELNKPRPSIRVGAGLMAIAWRVMALKDLLFRTKSSLTKETSISSQSSYYYSSDKVMEKLDTGFIDWKESVAYYARFYSRS